MAELKLNDGRRLCLDDRGAALDDRNGNRIEIDTESGNLTIESAGSLTIRSPQITIQASGSMVLEAGGTMTIQGALVQIN